MKTKTFFSINELIVITLMLLITIGAYAQESPWNVETKGENPWGQESAPADLTAADYYVPNYTQDIDSVLRVLNKKLSKDSSLSSSEMKDARTFVVNASSDTITYFNVSDAIIKLKIQNKHYYRKLRDQGRHAHDAMGALGLGMASATLVSVFALPFNLVASFIPTKKTRLVVNQFKINNPHASQKEVKAFKSGITRNRLSNAVVGVVVGTGANLYLLTIAGVADPSVSL